MNEPEAQSFEDGIYVPPDDAPLVPVEPEVGIGGAASGEFSGVTEQPGQRAAPSMSDSFQWPDQQRAADLHGPFDSFLARVVQTYYDTAAASCPFGCVQAISVERCDVRWELTPPLSVIKNEPVAAPIAQATGDTTPTVRFALPFPPRHDQQKYHVAVDEIVTVLQGKDGLLWYMRDELPFMASVIKTTALTDYEKDCGGAGLLSMTVRRWAMVNNPASAVPAFELFVDTSAAYIEYTNVLSIAPLGKSHGYRCGDPVWVERRGMYYFARPCKDSFLAMIHNAGPDSEANFTDNRYWVKELEPDIAVVAGVGNENKYTLTLSSYRAALDPDSTGRYGRWVQANNLADDDYHSLLTHSDIVTVHVHADKDTGFVGYTFERPIGVPSGVITMWSGTVASIPTGWALCDGSNGTPDLRDKFIVGAKQDDGSPAVAKTNVTGSLTQSGGAATHTHSSHNLEHSHTFSGNDGGHRHDLADDPGAGAGIIITSGGEEAQNYTDNTTVTISGTTGTGLAGEETHSTVSNLPPYYALAYIMKR